jgi:hypothetical protein
MKNTCVKIIHDLEKELQIIESEKNDSEIIRTEKAIKIIKLKINELRKFATNEGFSTSKDEIDFFKNIKPKIVSKLIYHVEIFNVKSKGAQGSPKLQKKYLDNEIKNYQVYLNNNLEFYKYFKRGETYLDKHYFLRNKKTLRLHSDSFHSFIDENFATSHDLTIAKFMGYEMVIKALQKEIELIEQRYNNEARCQTTETNFNVAWTGNKVGLVELIYALNAAGVINNGTADIKELASVFEQVFNIELGDYYRTFLEIRSRKMNNTKFIDLLKDKLVKRMEESGN